MSGSGRRSSDAALIVALATGATREEAAVAAGVSSRTVYRRCDESEFMSRVEDAQQDLISRSTARLGAATGQAIETLVDLLDAAQPPSVRLGAARAVLDSAMRWRDAEEIELRLAALEATHRATARTHRAAVPSGWGRSRHER